MASFRSQKNLLKQTLPISQEKLAGGRFFLCAIDMTAIAQELDQKLAAWLPEKAAKVEKLVTDIIHWADALDLLRFREVEQEVLDLLDED